MVDLLWVGAFGCLEVVVDGHVCLGVGTLVGFQ